MERSEYHPENKASRGSKGHRKGMGKSCLIVGAGMAGLTAAGVLASQGWRVRVVDKGRGVGGRMATRRMGEYRLDHGAQFFTVRDGRFAAAVERWVGDGAAAVWFEHEGHARYRGVEGMAGIGKYLAAGLDVRTGAKVLNISPKNAGWVVGLEGGEEIGADALILTPPAQQSLALCESFVGELSMEIPLILESITFDPCIALMVVGGQGGLVPEPGYVRPTCGPIAWVADNGRKGISQGGRAAITIHARADFSRARWDAATEDVTALLLAAAGPWIGEGAVETQLHRWRYSQPAATHTEPCLGTRRPGLLAFAGDAFAGPRVEGAFLSGLAAANIVIDG